MNSFQKKIIVVLGTCSSENTSIANLLEILENHRENNLIEIMSCVDSNDSLIDGEIHKFNELLLIKVESFSAQYCLIGAELFLNDKFREDYIIAKDLLKKKFSGRSLLIFDYPKTAVLLPFWQMIFKELELKDSYLIMLDNPMNRAGDSLTAEDDFLFEKNQILWSRHMMASILNSVNKTNCFVHYNDLLKFPREQLVRISMAFGLAIPQEHNESYSAHINELITIHLQGNKTFDCQLSNSEITSSFTKDLYCLLKKLSNDTLDPLGHEFNKVWVSLQNRYDNLVDLLRFTENLEGQNFQIGNELSLVRQTLEKEEISKINLENKIEYLHQEILDRDNVDRILNLGNKLTQVRDSLTLERDILAQERDALIQGRDTIILERDTLTQEKDTLALERDSLTQQKDTLSREQDTLVQEIDSLIKQKDMLALERDSIKQQRDTLIQERDSLTKHRDSLAQERNTLAQDKNSLIQERDTLILNQNLLTQDVHTLQMELKRISNINLELQNSTSWRMTSPLRSVKNKFSKIASR